MKKGVLFSIVFCCLISCSDSHKQSSNQSIFLGFKLGEPIDSVLTRIYSLSKSGEIRNVDTTYNIYEQPDTDENYIIVNGLYGEGKVYYFESSLIVINKGVYDKIPVGCRLQMDPVHNTLYSMMLINKYGSDGKEGRYKAIVKEYKKKYKGGGKAEKFKFTAGNTFWSDMSKYSFVESSYNSKSNIRKRNTISGQQTYWETKGMKVAVIEKKVNYTDYSFEGRDYWKVYESEERGLRFKIGSVGKY